MAPMNSKTIKRVLAMAELLLISPAVLFMAALFVRSLQPRQVEPAHTAQRIVMWYAARPRVGLWLLLMALPLIVLVVGCVALPRLWRDDADLRQAARQTLAVLRAQLATLLVAAAALIAGCVLAIVALHSLTD
jgi:sterol desaturase/sphingolipid hydroxylase (fatty acid hydroxylase superfamily)